ncbi:hypothetical protein [Photobacterium angustum]|uniref:hypothetical protein n=1 Tax=Photobacterium angustum TaxID=661 RepID=UPI0005E10FC8|nr:hypothetical protein [Photobacterium angustum]KJG03050.1 hypothetical protein UB35_04965 [Photobacterium angustum]PSV65096.1 hypothetical protein CTM95_17330 [Photobacterium angustum]
MSNKSLIKCDSIAYRKGYVEVCGGIHSDCINLEVWNIDPDINTISSDDFLNGDETVTANTEIELSIENAEELILKLQNAIEVAITEKG